MQLSEICGEPNSIKSYCDQDGYVYSINSRRSQTVYLSCKNKQLYGGCRGRVIVKDGNFEMAIFSHRHNHKAETKMLDHIKFQKKLEDICRENPFLKPLKVYSRAKRQLKNVINLKHISILRKYSTFIYRKQREDKPSLPNNITEFEELINNAQYTTKYCYDEHDKLLYRGVWRGRTGSNIVFISDSVLKEVKRHRKVKFLTDGTFKVLPHHISFRQLYIINVILFDRCYPLAFILTEKKDCATYELIFNRLKLMISNVEVTDCMSDYESATRKAFRNVFPKATISGCYFHYVQAIVKAFKRYGLNEPKFEESMQSVCALALLPNDYVIAGFKQISKSFKKSIRWKKFEDYWYEQWAEANISVYGLKNRTNNYAETLNKTLNQLMEANRPDIWSLIHNLKTLEMNKSDELINVAAGEMLDTRKNREMIRLNKKIEDATTKFNQDQNVKRFLKKIIFNDKLESFFKERIYIDGVDMEDDDDDDDYDETIIPNKKNLKSNFQQTSSGRRLQKNKKK